MRVLVTGASGLIGSALCDALLARGDEVVGLTRDPDRARPKNPKVRWHRWDATSGPPPQEALDAVDGVVNLVGDPLNQRWTKAAKRRILETRTVGTRYLLQAIEAAERRPRVFVGVSAVGYYGDRGAALLDEESEPGSSFDAQVCIAWEEAARDAESLGMRLVIARTGLVLSKHGGLLRQLLLPFRLGLGGPIAGGAQYMSWITLSDHIRLLLWALDDERVSGVVNSTSPNPVTNRELMKAFAAALRRPAVLPVPALVVRLSRGRELAETVKGGQRVLPRRATDLGFEFRHPEIREAMEEAMR